MSGRRLSGWFGLRGAALAVSIGALLGGCATPAEQPPQTIQQLSQAPPKSEPAPQVRVTPKAAQPRPAQPKPQVDPARIVGLETAALQRLLGDPWLKRDERTAQVWLYTSGACAFHVFLYADPATGRYVVRYFDAVPRDGIPVSRWDCFNALLRPDAQEFATGA